MKYTRLYTPFNMACGALCGGMISAFLSPETLYPSIAYGAVSAGLISAHIQSIARQGYSAFTPYESNEEAKIVRTVGYGAIYPAVAIGTMALPNILKFSGLLP